MPTRTSILPAVCLASFALLLSACQNDTTSGRSAAEEELVTLQRAIDRLERSSAACERSIARAAKRTSLALRERDERFKNDSALRAQVDLMQTRVDGLQNQFAAYRKNCTVGTLVLDSD